MKNLKEIIKIVPFVVGVAVLVNLFTYQALSLVHESPQYEDFCGERMFSGEITSPEICTEEGGLWHSYAQPISPRVEGEQVVTGYCDADYTCRTEYDEARQNWSAIMFIVLLVVGVGSLVAAQLFAVTAISLGFSYGGVFLLLGALTHLWQISGQLLQLVVITVLLGLLIWVGKNKLG